MSILLFVNVEMNEAGQITAVKFPDRVPEAEHYTIAGKIAGFYGHLLYPKGTEHNQSDEQLTPEQKQARRDYEFSNRNLEPAIDSEPRHLDLATAVQRFTDELRKDKGYKDIWMRNIAKSIKDQIRQEDVMHAIELYAVIDRGAMRFLNQLTHQPTTELSFVEAMARLREGKKIKLPEWTGYWFQENGKTKVFTRTGDILDTPLFSVYNDRKDWQVTDGSLGFDWALLAMKSGKEVKRRSWDQLYARVKIKNNKVQVVDIKGEWYEFNMDSEPVTATDWMLYENHPD